MDGDILMVEEQLALNKDYVFVCKVAPPKKDDGQSVLQIALKNGQFEIAKLLIKHGADVNFKETSKLNEWTAPVLHDCIRATIFSSHTLQRNPQNFEIAFSLLKLMLYKNSNPNATDSHGNNALHRALLDARQMLYNPSTDLNDGILLDQLRRVFKELIEAGADIKLVTDQKESAEQLYLNFNMDQYNLW